MKTLHQLLLGAGLLVTSPAAEAQRRADYAGTWLNTASYTQSVSRLDVHDTEDWAPRLETWEGVPASAIRRGLGYLKSQPAPDGTVARMVVRLKTADVTEMYVLDLQPNGTLWVLRHASQGSTAVRCDTMRFERLRNPGAVGKRSGRRTAERPPAPPEATARFTPATPPPAVQPALVAFWPR